MLALQVAAQRRMLPIPERPYKVVYNFKIPYALRGVVSKVYETFARDCLKELNPVMAQAVGQYVGSIQKGKRSGMGMIKLANGDVYKGNFRHGIRSGQGICMFHTGALYRGEFREDKPHG